MVYTDEKLIEFIRHKRNEKSDRYGNYLISDVYYDGECVNVVYSYDYLYEVAPYYKIKIGEVFLECDIKNYFLQKRLEKVKKLKECLK